MGKPQPCAPVAAPKTFDVWLECTLIANGVPDGLPWERALAVAQILVRTGRAIPANQWVDRFMLEQQVDEAEGLF